MKLYGFPLLLVLPFSAFSALGQAGRPVPPGIHQADQADAQAQQNIPPPAPALKARLDYAKLRSDAEELATLAQSIPSDVEQSTRGVLPKDLASKLKQIEKLAKHLRGELTP
jgi:hypothetical protein